MSAFTDFIIGIDLGSSVMTGMLGKRLPDGTTELLAIKRIPDSTGMRRGVIYNIEEVSRYIGELAEDLVSQSGQDIEVRKIYIGINGYSIRTLDVTSSLRLSGDELLNEDHLDMLCDEVVSKVPESLEFIDDYPQEFIVDGKMDINPVGSMPQYVEAHYRIIAAKPIVNRNIEACMSRLEIAHSGIIGPVASAEAILTEDDKSKGVVAVDFGAETTSVCIYKGNILRHVAILPFGSKNISIDLEQLNIDEEEAENLKLDKGTAIHYTEKAKDEEQKAALDSLSDFDKEANDIIVARVEEIVENIFAQIRYSGIEPQKIIEGIVITGGGSKLPGIVQLLEKKTGVKVREGDPAQNIIISDGIESFPEDTLAIGTLLLAEPDCCEIREIVQPKVEEPKVVHSEQASGELFNDVPKAEPKPKKEKPREKNKHKEPKPDEPSKVSKSFEFIRNLFMDDDDL